MRPGHESEYRLLAELVLTGENIGRVATLVQPSDFGDESLRRLYETILYLSSSGEEVSIDVINERLRQRGEWEEVGEWEFLDKVTDFYTAGGANLDFHARAVKKAAQERRFENHVVKANLDLSAGKAPEEIFERLNNNLSDLGSLSGEVVPKDDIDLLSQQLEQELVVGSPRGMKWPWDAMTDAVGRLIWGHMWVVSGFSGQGKSTFLRSLAAGLVLQGVPVVYFALEEKGNQVLGLMSCAVGGASYVRYGQGFPLTKKEVAAIRKGRDRLLGTDCLTINYEKSWRPTKLLARLRLYIRQMKCAVVIIDHAHLIEYPLQNKNDHLARFAERFHGLVQEENVVGVVAYQPRKPGEGGDVWRPVSPDEIRDASQIWNITENMLSPFRPWVKTSSISGKTALDPAGYPEIVKPFTEDSEPVKDYFFLQPGKARIGGSQGRPVVLRFDPLTGRVLDF